MWCVGGGGVLGGGRVPWGGRGRGSCGLRVPTMVPFFIFRGGIQDLIASCVSFEGAQCQASRHEPALVRCLHVVRRRYPHATQRRLALLFLLAPTVGLPFWFTFIRTQASAPSAAAASRAWRRVRARGGGRRFLQEAFVCLQPTKLKVLAPMVKGWGAFARVAFLCSPVVCQGAPCLCGWRV